MLDLSARADGDRLISHIVGIGKLSVKDNPMDASRIHSLPAAARNGYAYSPVLRRWLRERLPRYAGVVIHGAWTYAGWAAASECLRAGVPYAYYPHGMLEAWAMRGQGPAKALKKFVYWHWRERDVARNARCVFFTTEREQRSTGRVLTIDSPQAILRPYGIETSVDPTASPANPSLVQPAGSRVGLFLGRLHFKKNIQLLLEAWHTARMPPLWRLVIAGSGDSEYKSLLRRTTMRLGLADSVQFVGFVTGRDKRYLLQHADWFLLPSLQENFGIAVLEAVEQGCAVAISDCVYLAESFRPESEVLPLRASAWVEFFQSRMQDPEWRARVAREDREHLSRTFSMEGIVRQWRDTFLSLFWN